MTPRKIRPSMDTELRNAVQLAEADRLAEHRAARAKARQVEANRVRITREQIVGAKFIRYEFGWRHVVKVNAKSVTVRSMMYPQLVERLSFDKVLEVLP